MAVFGAVFVRQLTPSLAAAAGPGVHISASGGQLDSARVNSRGRAPAAGAGEAASEHPEPDVLIPEGPATPEQLERAAVTVTAARSGY